MAEAECTRKTRCRLLERPTLRCGKITRNF
nr:MAG TPA: hypothetical protein [Caudoviricetes sp.]